MYLIKPIWTRPGSMLRTLAAATLLALAGCSLFMPQPPPPAPPAPPPKPQLAAPVATHTFPFDPKSTGVVGELQVTYSHQEDTFADIARRYNLGYDELVNANPGVDAWLPGEGTRIVLPTQFVLPDAPTEGLVVNLAALRLFYFPKPAKDQPRVVITYPIGIGMVGWATPTGTTKVVSKRKDPVWTPPESVRKEHAADGDTLPARVPAGPDNPLGAFAMNLGWPTYLMHGTNKPAGVGMRASHGCIRLYPEDIATLFDRVAVGVPVTVVNQPLVYRWQGDSLYVQSYPPHEDHPEAAKAAMGSRFNKALADKMWQRAKPHAGTVDLKLAEQVVNDARGVAVPVSRSGVTYDGFVAGGRLVENRIPAGATWDGSDNPVPTARAQPANDAGRR
jgi:L,D-transpeptidase ErfK/SrfK